MGLIYELKTKSNIIIIQRIPNYCEQVISCFYSLEIVKKSVLFLKTTDNGLTEIVKITIDSFVKESLMNQVKMLAPG